MRDEDICKRLCWLKDGINYTYIFFFFFWLDFQAVLSMCVCPSICMVSNRVISSWLCCSLDHLSFPSHEVKALSHSPSCKTWKWNTELSRFHFWPDVTLSFDVRCSPHVSNRGFWCTLGLGFWGWILKRWSGSNSKVTVHVYKKYVPVCRDTWDT